MQGLGVCEAAWVGNGRVNGVGGLAATVSTGALGRMKAHSGVSLGLTR